MNTLLIGYDLNRTGQNYDDLIKAIKAHGTWWHHLDSTWLVKTALTAAQMRDDLWGKMDKNDELLVVNVTGDAAAWQGFTEKGQEWLRNNI
jgi:hypothetical protein